MGLEQRVEDLEIQQAQWDVVIRGTHDVVILILKEQRQLERKFINLEERFDRLEERMENMEKRLDDRIDRLEKKFDDRIDKLERLIVSALAEKVKGVERKDLT